MTSRYSSGGFTDRFRVTRTDGEPINPAARYLVLDYSGRDPAAQQAVRAYADAVEATNPELAADLRDALVNPAAYPAQH